MGLVARSPTLCPEGGDFELLTPAREGQRGCRFGRLSGAKDVVCPDCEAPTKTRRSGFGELPAGEHTMWGGRRPGEGVRASPRAVLHLAGQEPRPSTWSEISG